MNFTRSLFIAAALISTGSAALAQATIDQNKALAGGFLPGDSAGFPITITQPGSYKLMSNLVVPPNVEGIQISADGVTLDLNGFKISSTGVCTQNASTLAVGCTGLGSIGITASLGMNVNIRNGTVQGFKHGIYIDSGIVDGVSLRHNENGFSSSMWGSGYLSVRNSSAELNTVGFLVRRGTIERSQAFRNGFGMFGNADQPGMATVLDSTAVANATGISSATLHSTRSAQNKLDLINTAAY